MEEYVFLSHSHRDKKLLDEFIKCFGLVSGIAAKPYEYELKPRDSKASDNIRKLIADARALFVLVGPKVVARSTTTNWIAMEIGMAHAATPQVPIWVFEDLSQSVDFHAPELDHHVLFDSSDNNQSSVSGFWYWLRSALEYRDRNELMPGLVSPGFHLSVKTKRANCAMCKLSFGAHYADNVSEPSCPSCRRQSLTTEESLGTCPRMFKPS